MNTINVPVDDLRDLLVGMSDYIEMTKEASKPSVSPSKVEDAIYALCENGLLSVEKRAKLIDDIRVNPDTICELIEKLATRVGPSSLGDSDSMKTDGRDAERSFMEFCLL